MFLVHFSNESLETVLSWDTRKIKFWFDKAVSLHNLMNKTKEENEE